tara:strand:- start:466 stop:741 length:276 start_codon:yes stop_codon:yes gene_type:complete
MTSIPFTGHASIDAELDEDTMLLTVRYDIVPDPAIKLEVSAMDSIIVAQANSRSQYGSVTSESASGELVGTVTIDLGWVALPGDEVRLKLL